MNNKILFRGFRPDKNGETVITFNGEKIHGKWVYGYPVQSGKTVSMHVPNDEVAGNYAIYVVIPETVGQFVATDKNGKDLFDGDIVRFTDKYGAKPTSSGLAKIEWYKYGYCLNGSYDKGLIKGTILYNIRMSTDMEYELIGNKWECAE